MNVIFWSLVTYLLCLSVATMIIGRVNPDGVRKTWKDIHGLLAIGLAVVGILIWTESAGWAIVWTAFWALLATEWVIDLTKIIKEKWAQLSGL